MPGGQVGAGLRVTLPGAQSAPRARAPGAACPTGTPRRSGLSELVVPLSGSDSGDECRMHDYLLVIGLRTRPDTIQVRCKAP
jgi:hypothetical protein